METRLAALPNLRHLRILSEVTRRGSVSAAARAVALSQPAVTQAVLGLEREFGASLFARSTHGVTPTDAGLALAMRMERVLQQLRSGLPEAVRPGRGAMDEPLHALTSAQLEALVAVVEEGTFGRAARASGVARATVHRAARQLELVLGVPLFEATSHGLRPTRDAERLARGAQLALAEVAQARAELSAAAGKETGLIVVGAMPLARSVLVPAAVLEFARRNPRHAISILDGPYESMLHALRRGRADVLVGALRETIAEDCVQEQLFDDPLAIIVRAGHPLAGRRKAPRRDELARFPWIAPREGSPLRLNFDLLLADRAGDPPAAAIECNSLVAARALLLASDRAMLLSAHQVHHELAAGELVALPHPDGPVVRPIGLTIRRNWRPTRAQAELVAVLRELASRYAAAAQSSADPAAARKARGATPIRRAKKREKYAGSSKPR